MQAALHVILNPHAGGGRGRRIRGELQRELAARGLIATIEETDHPGHAVALARSAAERGTRTVVAAGGDGTVHEVANGLLQARNAGTIEPTSLGVIPIGTGNDFVKMTTGGPDRRAAYDALGAGHVRHFDVGRVEWDGGSEYFVNGAGTGIDVEVVRQINRLPRIPGLLSYLIGLIRALRGYVPVPLSVHLDDGLVVRDTVMIIAVGNGRCVGGGFFVCPGARPDDGLFDVCVVRELGLLGIARVLPRILRGTHIGQPEVAMHRSASVEFVTRGPAPLFFQLDGELREPPGARSLRISLEAGVLPVCTTAGPDDPSGPRPPRGEHGDRTPSFGDRS